MLYRLKALVLFAAMLPLPALATTESCSSTQTAQIEAAISGAHSLLEKAIDQVGENSGYVKWFGSFDASRAATVKGNLQTLRSHMLIGVITSVCSKDGVNACAAGTFASVAPSDPYRIYICDDFFGLPTFPVKPPLTIENGTQEGTFIHEMTRFDIVNQTDDLCYGRSACQTFAATNSSKAILNADSNQYVAEDASELLY